MRTTRSVAITTTGQHSGCMSRESADSGTHGSHAPKTIQLVCDDDRRYMAGLPTSLWLTLNGKRFLLVHATPRDPMDEFAPPDLEAWKRRLQGIDADYVCVGHSHVQYMLQVGKTTVINPGSVGLPRDGDPRPAYAIITDDGPELKRVNYPIDEAVAALYAAKLPEPALLALSEVLRTGRLDRKKGESGLNGNCAPGSNGEVRNG